MTDRHIHLASALLPDGWAESVVLALDAGGDITAVRAGVAESELPAGAERVAGIALPGLPNVHSHAHQRAMAGLAERSGPGQDTFWTWRETMYAFAQAITPDDLEVIAAQAYAEMLAAGYTSVAEFQYLHHAPDGRPYDRLPEMTERCLAAARRVGIGITLLPVLYAHGDFGGAPAGQGQRRFLNDGDRFARLLGDLAASVAGDGNARLGMAPHSLRAVTPALLDRARGDLDAIDAAAPIHIHIAEQEKEVAACRDWSGQTPVDWLLAHQPVDARWCLIHATHMSAAETEALAASRAVAGLCPTTEANLGDGLFPAIAYQRAGGRLAIGSDSHISLDPAEELRLLEHGQRLVHRGRTLLAGGPERSVGCTLVEAALAGGAVACGRPIGALAPGRRADLIVLDADAPMLAGRAEDNALDTWIFHGQRRPLVRHAMVGGRWVIRDGAHGEEAAIAQDWTRTVNRLAAL